MFATDGVKLPSNVSKHRSGTRADFARQADKLEAAVTTMVQRHRSADTAAPEPDPSTKATRRIERLQRDAAQTREWLATHPEDQRGATGGIRKSNRTDNTSATMATSKGVIQGYTEIATVDHAHQIIVDAQAHGTGSEHELLVAVTQRWRAPHTLITADAGYQREANLRELAQMEVRALNADPDMRRRDARSCVCPAGKSLYRKGGGTSPTAMSANTFVVHSVPVCRARYARSACVRQRRCSGTWT